MADEFVIFMGENRISVQAMSFEHSTWENEAGELISALYVKTLSADGDSRAYTSIHCYPTSKELRDLAAMLTTAAENLDANAAFIKARDEAKAGEGA